MNAQRMPGFDAWLTTDPNESSMTWADEQAAKDAARARLAAVFAPATHEATTIADAISEVAFNGYGADMAVELANIFARPPEDREASVIRWFYRLEKQIKANLLDAYESDALYAIEEQKQRGWK